MKKKILGILICGILVLGITGCGEKSKTEDGKSNISKNSLASVVKVGDYVDYKTKLGETYSVSEKKSGVTATQVFETTGNEKWRVLSVEENGTVNLISVNGITPKNQKAYVVDEAFGYLNFVDELNNICKIYGTGEFAKEARSIDLDDFYELIGWDNLANYYGIDPNGSNVKEDIYKAMNSRYGNNGTRMNSKNTNSPNLKGSNGYATKNEFDISSNVRVDFKSNMRSDTLQYKSMSIYNNDTLVKEMLGQNYWLATTFEDYHDYGESYDLDKVYGVYFATSEFKVGAKALAFNIINISGDNDLGKSNLIRPIVTLNVDVKHNGGSGTETDPFTLK